MEVDNIEIFVTSVSGMLLYDSTIIQLVPSPSQRSDIIDISTSPSRESKTCSPFMFI